MLKSLQIRNYDLIDSLDVSFPEGLIIITGQTGAGKSILLGALSMLLGSKADSSVIGSRGDNCVVEAVFEIPEGDEVTWNILRDNDLDGSSSEVVARRRAAPVLLSTTLQSIFRFSKGFAQGLWIFIRSIRPFC